MTLPRSRPDDWPTLHDRARAALSDQLDGELDAGEAGWLDAHLAGCPDCRRAADEFAAQRFELRKLRDRQPLPPRDLWARTAAAIEAEAAGRPGGRRTSTRRLLVRTPAFIATALAVVVATGVLTSSQLTNPRGDGSGSSVPEVALHSDAATGGGRSLAPEKTPIAFAKRIDYVGPDAEGNLRIKTATVDQVCPAGATQPCDASQPVEERSVTIDANAQAVFGDGDDGKRLIVVSSPTTRTAGTVAVVTLASDTVDPASSGSPTPPPSTPASPSISASQTTASASPSEGTASPTPSPTLSAAPTPIVTASPTGSVDVTPPSGETREIANGVALVGQTAAYSRSGAWFAFTARPIDGSAGPDIYLWKVGTEAARKVTDDGRTVFGSWVGENVVASRVVDPGSAAASPSPNGLKAESFLLDPATDAQTALPQTGSAWRPVVDPSGRKAVYWTGTLRVVPGPGFAPGGGRLVLGEWGISGPTPSGSPDPTPLSGDQGSARRETTIGAGQIDDWDARWDPSGTHLAVWIADHQNPAVGLLSLYAVSSFDGSIDLKTPVLSARRAAAGFALSDGSLIWAEPPSDPGATEGSIQLLAWSDQGVGSVQTLSGPALVIR